MPIWEDPFELTLPDHEDAEFCYDDLQQQPTLHQIFHQVIVPLATNGGDLADRIRKIEAARMTALERVSDTPEMIVHDYVPFDCCLLDFYNGFVYTLGTIIRDSDLPRAEKLAGLQQLYTALEEAVPWNPFKKIELTAVASTFEDEIDPDTE